MTVQSNRRFREIAMRIKLTPFTKMVLKVYLQRERLRGYIK